jgi:hypothetical protein
VATPDKIDTSIGTLKLSDGYPDADTIEKIYDNLDQSRALQAYLLAIPIYQLADAANPPAMKFVNASGIPSNFVAPADYSFWELLNKVIQEEPSAPNDLT